MCEGTVDQERQESHSFRSSKHFALISVGIEMINPAFLLLIERWLPELCRWEWRSAYLRFRSSWKGQGWYSRCAFQGGEGLWSRSPGPLERKEGTAIVSSHPGTHLIYLYHTGKATVVRDHITTFAYMAPLFQLCITIVPVFSLCPILAVLKMASKLEYY